MTRGLLLLLAVGACAKEKSAPEVPASVEPAASPPAAAKAADRTRSLVTVLCSEGSGPGFFSAPDRVVTRARFACPVPLVRLHDGRKLIAAVRTRQKELDLAELLVSGGEGEPLDIASALALGETDDVSVPGLGRGTVRAVARTRLGVPHFEVAFERVPAPGSVVVDAAGHAVGLTTDATSVLPLDALGPGPRWAELQERSKPALAQELAALRRALMKPGLVTALQGKGGALSAVLLSYTPASAVRLSGCDTTLRAAWEPFRASSWLDAPSRELFRFLDANDLDVGLSMSTVAIPPGACGGAELFLEGADPLLHRAAVVKVDQVLTPTQPQAQAPAQAQAQQAPAPRLDDTDERIWRGRFSALREETELFERDLRDKQRFIADADRATVIRSRRGVLSVLAPEQQERYEQYKRDLEEAPQARAAFLRRMDDLEREASNASVPREWRR